MKFKNTIISHFITALLGIVIAGICGLIFGDRVIITFAIAYFYGMYAQKAILSYLNKRLE